MLDPMSDDEMQELADQFGVSVDDLPDVLSAVDGFEYGEGQKDIEHAVFLDENDIGGFDLDSGEFF